MRSHSASAMTNGNPATNWPGPAFRSAGVPPAPLTFPSKHWVAQLAAAAGFDKETFYVVGSYLTTEARTNMAVVCRAGGKHDL
jgi:hypothetical protein